MLATFLLVTNVALAEPAPAPSPASASEHTIAVMALKPATPSATDDAKLESVALVDAVRAAQGPSGSKVLSLDDVRALLDLKAAQQLMGCDDPRCATDVTNALAADVVVAGTAGSLGGSRHVFLTLLDGKKGRVVGRASYSWTGDDVKTAMKKVATVAFSADGAESGDQLLSDLRTAVVVDELDAAGKPLSLGRVAACVQGELMGKGAPVVSADQVKRIRAKLDPTQSLSAQPVDTLDVGDVDVILSGSVRYADAGKYHTNVASRASLTFELVKVDTGEVLASATTSSIARAPSMDGAIDQAAAAVCKQVSPELTKALDVRIERGHRVVVNAAKATTPDGATKLQRDLEALKPLVARTKLRKVDGKGAVVDVTLRGGDGVALALAFDKAGQGARIASASAGTLSLKD